jgi:DNA-directed RNA polymerase specialized sigma24 family protein
VDPPKPPKYSEETVAKLQAEILRACERRRIPAAIRADFINEIWLWLLRMDEEPAVTRAWVEASVGTFWRHFQRRLWRQYAREISVEALEKFEVPVSPAAEGAARLNECAGGGNGREGSLIGLMAGGLSFIEACRKLGIPAGSYSYWRSRVREHARVYLAEYAPAALVRRKTS